MNDRDRFDKFTKRARKVLSLAQEEAQRFHHNYIGTEHLLLGLVHEGEGVAARVLMDLGVELTKVRSAVEFVIGRGDRIVLGEIGLTPRAKKVIDLAVDEARRMDHHYVGTEHLLLGLIREGEGIAAGVLVSLGLTLEQLRAQTLIVVGERGSVLDQEDEPPAPAAGPKNNVITCRLDDRALDALDALVEAGIRSTRSDAAAWLIGAGIEAHHALFDHVYATVQEIRQLRQKAQSIAQQMATDASQGGPTAPPPPSAPTPPEEEQPGV
jgi:ATP-dependent Clp protease ATP-binding subunit ClpA